jgi:hypothetical protein
MAVKKTYRSALNGKTTSINFCSYGANLVEPRETKSFFELCLEPFEDTIL